ncbi:MAG: hypothetical protein MHM6MM_000480 [Cercozoa sp. M6MM]
MRLAWTEVFQRFVPPLTELLHKGSCGRIVVVGGSRFYTGAPYFSAAGAYRLGADLVSVLTTKEAAMAIRSFSPELMVCDSLGDDDAETQAFAQSVLQRADGVVVGPGLGRTTSAQEHLRNVLPHVRNVLVLDADALSIMDADALALVRAQTCVLTPNVAEMSRLYSRFVPAEEQERLGAFEMNPDTSELLPFVDEISDATRDGVPRCVQQVTAVARHTNCVILRKGAVDFAVVNDRFAVFAAEGALRRCGGQGDLLSGAAALYCSWAFKATETEDSSSDCLFAALFAASTRIRQAAHVAFQKHGEFCGDTTAAA